MKSVYKYTFDEYIHTLQMCMDIQNITLEGLSVYLATQGIILFINLNWPELFKEKHHNIIVLAIKSLTVLDHIMELNIN